MSSDYNYAVDWRSACVVLASPMQSNALNSDYARYQDVETCMSELITASCLKQAAGVMRWMPQRIADVVCVSPLAVPLRPHGVHRSLLSMTKSRREC
jgi:hypothetical protein